MTRNLKIYTLFCILWSLLFFTGLNWGTALPEERGLFIGVFALTYGLGFALLGYLLGKNDDDSKVRYGLSQAYSATSNFTSAIIGGVWVVFFKREDLWSLVLYSVGIAVLLAIGVYNYKKSIKGMKNKDLFQ